MEIDSSDGIDYAPTNAAWTGTEMKKLVAFSSAAKLSRTTDETEHCDGAWMRERL